VEPVRKGFKQDRFQLKIDQSAVRVEGDDLSHFLQPHGVRFGDRRASAPSIGAKFVATAILAE
jgi:hypothetical protein